MSNLQEQIQAYKNKTINWITLAETLTKYKQSCQSLKEWQDSIVGIDTRRVSELIRAYSIIESEAPQWLQTPELVKGSIYSIIALPAYWDLLKQQGKDRDYFNVIIEKVIKGEENADTIVERLRKEEVTLKPKVDYNLQDVFLAELKVLSYLLDQVMKDPTLVVSIRDKVSLNCHDVATKLESIHNEAFYKLYKERKEIVV